MSVFHTLLVVVLIEVRKSGCAYFEKHFEIVVVIGSPLMPFISCGFCRDF